MSTDFADLHDELRSVAAGLLAKDDVDWPQLAQAGWVGLEVADALGGAGATFGEVAVICQELGRAATHSGYLGGAVLAVGALNMLQPNPSRDRLLTGIAAGEVRAAVAVPGEGPALAFERDREGLVHGTAVFVPDAAAAARMLLPAHDADGPVLIDVPTDALTVTAQPVLDATRELATVTADGVTVGESAVWRFDGDPQAAVRGLLDRAAVAVACDSLGLSEAMLAATVSYVGVRRQFGRAIGSFQAVKHACADMHVQVQVARRLVAAAVDAVAAGGPDVTVAASMAKAYACGTAVDVTGTALQLHGGIGYTWESGIHVFLKRAALNRSLFGSPAGHRAQLATRYTSTVG